MIAPERICLLLSFTSGSLTQKSKFLIYNLSCNDSQKISDMRFDAICDRKVSATHQSRTHFLSSLQDKNLYNMERVALFMRPRGFEPLTLRSEV